MPYKFTCQCESKEFTVDLISAWECWRVGEDGEIAEFYDSGNYGWGDLRCATCEAQVESVDSLDPDTETKAEGSGL